MHHPAFADPAAAPRLARRPLLRALLAGTLLPAAGVARAGFNFFTSEYTASRAELQTELAKHFPVRQRYAQVITIGLQAPTLSLLPSQQRVALSAQLTIDSPLLQPSSLPGRATLSTALRYDANALAIRLVEPRMEQITLQGVGGRDAERLQQIAALVAQELLRDHVLHSFRAEELTLGRKTYEIGEIRVLDEGLRVQLL